MSNTKSLYTNCLHACTTNDDRTEMSMHWWSTITYWPYLTPFISCSAYSSLSCTTAAYSTGSFTHSHSNILLLCKCSGLLTCILMIFIFNHMHKYFMASILVWGFLENKWHCTLMECLTCRCILPLLQSLLHGLVASITLQRFLPSVLYNTCNWPKYSHAYSCIYIDLIKPTCHSTRLLPHSPTLDSLLE